MSNLDIHNLQIFINFLFLKRKMAEIQINNFIKFYTLVALHQGPKHGYELIKLLEKKLNRNISQSNIYPFLKKLQDNNIIKLKKTRERDKKIYSLTSDGKKFVDKMLNRFGELVNIAITPKLTVCSHCGCKIYQGGHKEKIKTKILAFCCYHCAKAFKDEMK